MSVELKVAMGLSLGLHAAAFVGWPAAASPVVFDVERASTSVEIVLLAPAPVAIAPPVHAEEPIPTPPEPSPESTEPEPQTIVAPERRGALTDMLPSYLKNPPPRYPWRARQQGTEGTVVLDAEVLPSGMCGRLRIARSSGSALLDEAARSAISGWRFQPALRGARPVAVWVEIPVTFRLLDERTR